MLTKDQTTGNQPKINSNLSLDKLRSRKENLVIRDGGIREVLLQASKFIETNLTESKEVITKLFLSLILYNDGEKISTIEKIVYILRF